MIYPLGLLNGKVTNAHANLKQLLHQEKVKLEGSI